MTVLLSGIAKGSDYFWIHEGYQRGYKTVGYSFAKHKGNGTAYYETVVEVDSSLKTKHEFEYLNSTIISAAKALNKNIPSNEYVYKLIYRTAKMLFDCSLVKGDELLLGVGSYINGLVTGGTGWTVELCKIIRPDARILFYDQNKNQWLDLNNDGLPIETPTLINGKNILVGTREITSAGVEAIREVFDKTKDMEKQ